MESDADVLISAMGVEHYYGSHIALAGIDLQLLRGEVLGFLGPNGAGKSTTMQLLSGTLGLQTGRVVIAGHDLAKQARQAKRHIGYLPENPPLYTDATVDEYLDYCGRLRELSHRETLKATARAKSLCAIEAQSNRVIATLSKGYQQRVGIAQAILHEPDVLILDEPTVGLDPNQIRDIRTLIRDLGERHAVILSTHILPEVETLCSRVILLHQGRIVLDQAIKPERPVLKVKFARPPSAMTLQAISGIEHATDTDAGYQLLKVGDTHSAAIQISEKSVAENWGLLEITPTSNSLEQTFVQLTTGETVPMESPA